jgi:hypothetical protein
VASHEPPPSPVYIPLSLIDCDKKENKTKKNNQMERKKIEKKQQSARIRDRNLIQVFKPI